MVTEFVPAINGSDPLRTKLKSIVMMIMTMMMIIFMIKVMLMLAVVPLVALAPVQPSIVTESLKLKPLQWFQLGVVLDRSAEPSYENSTP